jgi:hypothetical protein
MELKMNALKTLVTVSFSAIAIATASIAATPEAHALTFGFGNIAGGDTVGDSLAGGFGMEVTDAGDGNVLFQIFNKTNAANFIAQVYFDDASPSLLSNPVVNTGNVGNVLFEVDNGTLPQGNNLTPPFVESFGFDRVTGGPGNEGNVRGVQTGETLGIRFTGNFANVIAALNSGDLRTGIHVQGIEPNSSDAYVSIPTPALLPAGAMSLISVLRKRRKASEAVG